MAAISPVLRHPPPERKKLTVPVQLALQVCDDVHVGDQLLARPGAARVGGGQVAARLLGDAVQLVVAGTARLRVAGRVPRRDDAVGGARRRAGAELDAGGARLVDRPAGVLDLDEEAVQRGRDRARDAAEVPADVRVLLDAVDRVVHERERPARLLDAVGRALVVGNGIHAAGDLAVGILVAVLEGEEGAVGGVDESFPGADVVADLHEHGPGQSVGDRAAARHGDELEVRIAELARHGERADVRGDGGARGVRRHVRDRRDADVAPLRQAEEDEVAVLDRGADRVVPDRDAVDDAREVDEDQSAPVVDPDSRRRRELGHVDPEVAFVGFEIGLQRAPDLRLEGGVAVRRSGRGPGETVSDAAAGDERPAQDERGDAPRARVEEDRAVGHAEGRQRGAKALRLARVGLLQGLRDLGNIEIGMTELSLTDGARLGNHLGVGRQGRSGTDEQSCPEAPGLENHGAPFFMVGNGGPPALGIRSSSGPPSACRLTIWRKSYLQVPGLSRRN